MYNVSFQGPSIIELNPQKYTEIKAIKKFTKTLKPPIQNSIVCWQRCTANLDENNLLVMVRNHDRGFVKFVPTRINNQKIIEEIVTQTDEILKNAKTKLTAWILGGGNIKSTNGNRTIETLNKIADEICDRPDIDTSILVGINKAQENIVVEPGKDLIKICLEKPKNTNLENVFDIVELNNTEII